MKNHRIFWIAVALIAATFSAHAQITVTQSSFPGPGFSYTSHLLTTGDFFSVGSAGANQTWTFANYDWNFNEVVEVLAPAGTPYVGSFPAATRAIHNEGGVSYMYEQITASAYFILGSASPSDTSIYTPAMKMAQLPATYQTSWYTARRTERELAPGMVMLMLDSTASIVDAWGTCTTPYGSAPVLRIAGHNWTSTFLNGELMASSEYLSYAWVNAQGIAMVNVDSDDDVVDPNFSFGVIEMMEAGDAVEPVRGPVARNFSVEQNYPNPFNPSTVLPVELAKNTQVKVDIYDETGRKVSSREMELPAGRHELSVDGSAWSTGNYFARVTAGNEVQTKRMLLVK